MAGSRTSIPAGPRTPPPPPPPSPPPPSDAIELTGPGVPSGSWFFAEGAASSAPNGFSTYYLVQNANPVAVAMRAYYVTEGGQIVPRQYTLPARSRVTLSLAAEVGAGVFSTVFQSQTAGYDISVERSMYFGPKGPLGCMSEFMTLPFR